ncbi:uncharacterized protein LOC123942209 [Meles meles]|uniref:uncharacterized protein LOC123942209 n=1 Tax=Meles meles TaxID=9662 RepID=UPI001E69EAE9|nr:uncharacterized protein LOC123942209 [Meles meles]
MLGFSLQGYQVLFSGGRSSRGLSQLCPNRVFRGRGSRWDLFKAGERAVGGEEGGRCLSAAGVQEEAVRGKCPRCSGWGVCHRARDPVASSPAARRGKTSAHFLLLVKPECHYSNGTERVRLLDRYFYNSEEFVRFDSDVGEYRPVTELGRPIAQGWNSQKDIMERKRSEVDTVCRHNHRVFESFRCSGELPVATAADFRSKGWATAWGKEDN